jgi:catechol 2,3-dioxygenase-like lactoylglutathione lyase family enzyme
LRWRRFPVGPFFAENGHNLSREVAEVVNSKLAYYFIRTSDLEASRRFYTEIMGLRVGYLPPFVFSGIWLCLGDDESEFGVIHIIGVDPDDPAGLTRYLGDKPMDAMVGTGAFDHNIPSERLAGDARASPRRRGTIRGAHFAFARSASSLSSGPVWHDDRT